jgi:hypothetical protein
MPCRTLNYSIGAVDPAGEVIVIANGSYAGANITKSVKINVPSGVVAFSALPITVNAAPADVVVLRGLTLKAFVPGTGTAIQINSGAKVYVEECVIDGWNDGVVVNSPAQVFITGTTVRNTADNGVVSYAGEITIEKSRLEGNAFAGVNVFGGVLSMRDCVIAANGSPVNGAGVAAQGGVLNVESTLLTKNEPSAVFAGGAVSIARLSHSVITASTWGLYNAGGGAVIESFGNNFLRGNGTDSFGTITTVTLQ